MWLILSITYSKIEPITHSYIYRGNLIQNFEIYKYVKPNQPFPLISWNTIQKNTFPTKWISTFEGKQFFQLFIE